MTTAIIAPIVGKSLAGMAMKKFGTSVIERWTRHRAEQFFKTFVEACAADLTSDSKTGEALLDEILADEKKTEALFDAYRRICFSKSKDLGPRIIGLLTGKLVHENRMADGEEEAVFLAAELLSDGELLDFMKQYHEHRTKAEGVEDREAKHHMLGEAVYVRWNEEGAIGVRTAELDIGPFPWDEAFGRWAVDLSQCGLMSARIIQHMKQDESAYVESQATVVATVVTTITFSRGCKLLYDLLTRGLRVNSNHGAI